jgi:carbonic anhydrase
MRVPSRTRLIAATAIVAIGSVPASAAVGAIPPKGGQAQSPIDIRVEDVTFVDELAEIRFRYPNVALEVINLGSPDPEATIRAVVNSRAAMRVSGTNYRLSQFHFHTPSEHRLDGQGVPMELHLVHESDAGELLVLGVLMEPGRGHRELRRIFRDLPADAEARTIEGFDLDDLIPDDDKPIGTTDR